MNKSLTIMILALGIVLSAGTATAASDKVNIEDITMQVMEGEQAREIIQKIDMPPKIEQSGTNERLRKQEQERHREMQQDASDAMQEQHQQMQEMQEQMKDSMNEMKNYGMGQSN